MWNIYSQVLSVAWLVTGVRCFRWSKEVTRPNIVMIVADDLGWNDVSWHNSDIPTPRMEKLAREGVILEQSYMQQVCTPSRAALLTGRYPFSIGRQKRALKPLQPTGLDLNLTTLPEQLGLLGYKTHMVGKWHLGYCKWEYTPTYRGFDDFLGFYLGSQNYFTHDREYKVLSGDQVDTFYDFREDEDVAREGYDGKYSTKIFKKRINQIIASTKNKRALNVYGRYDPFFIYASLQSVHAPLQATVGHLKKVARTDNPARDIYKAMLVSLDKAVGEIEDKLRVSGLYNDTIIIFTTDNGGAISHGASNWPLRGTKGTLFEGGTRSVGFVHSPSWLAKKQYTNNRLIHVTDWMPTLLSLGGYQGDAATQLGLDGVNQWGAISRDEESGRREMVYNLRTDPIQGAVRIGDHKIIFGKKFNKQGWYDTESIALQCNRLRKDKKLRRKADRNGKRLNGGQGFRQRSGLSLVRTMPKTKEKKNKRKNMKRLGRRRGRGKAKRKAKSRNRLLKGYRRRSPRNNLKSFEKIWKSWLPSPTRETQRLIKLRMDDCNWHDFLGHSPALELIPRQRDADIVELMEPMWSPFNITAEDEDSEFEEGEEEELESRIRQTLEEKFEKVDIAMYNVIEDPEERQDLQEQLPELFQELRQRALYHLRKVVPADFPDQVMSGHPRNFGGVFSPGWC